MKIPKDQQEALLACINEYMEKDMLERDQFSVLCARCGERIGRMPGLCEKLAEGRLLDEIRQHHLSCPKLEKQTMKKYVVLEHLKAPNRGFRFYSLNDPSPEKLKTGEVAYKIVLETDDQGEAFQAALTTNFSALYTSEKE